jgi:hypothetical protein
MNEIWKPIPDYENYYEVSNFGRVRSLDRTIMRGDTKVNRKGKVLAQIKNCSGAPKVNIKRHGKSKPMLVINLVLRAFTQYQGAVEFIDGDKANCRIDNLKEKGDSNGLKVQ